MAFNPRWLNWLEEDEEGNLTILKEDTPEDIRKDIYEMLEENRKYPLDVIEVL